MFIVQDYSLAVLFCVVTMLCWGSWGNTQKLASKTWRYEFFYWDYVLGILVFSLISAFKRPVQGEPVSIAGYFKGNINTHLVGILGGVIWCIGQSFSMIASEKAGAAISCGLGQGATLISALWGIFIWKEFKGAPKESSYLNAGMFVLFVTGLGFLIYAGA